MNATENQIAVGQEFVFSSTKGNPFDKTIVRIADIKLGYCQYEIKMSDGTWTGDRRCSQKISTFLNHYEPLSK